MTTAQDSQIYRLDSARVSVVIDCRQGMPEMVYLGPTLSVDTDCVGLADALALPIARAALDIDTRLSMHPQMGHGNIGHPALIAHRPTTIATGFDGIFTVASVSPIAATVDCDAGLIFQCVDQSRNLSLQLTCHLHESTGVMTLASALTNTGDDTCIVDWLAAASISLPPELTQQICFDGSWCREFARNRLDIPRGHSGHDNRTGRTSFEAFPGRLFVGPHTDELSGPCLGVHLAWSGNHRLVVERLASGEVCVQMGVLPLAGEIQLQAGETIKSPAVYLATSDGGLNALSQSLHEHIRHSIVNWPAAAQPRPVTLNTWEAVYFKHDQSTLFGLVDKAADIGIERFVLDDGWFKGRDDDTTSLGDWQVDRRKYPQGLHPLIDRVIERKMQFGLWLEPEMVSEDSDLYRQHPDWVLGVSDYAHITGRQQLVLDLSNEQASEAIFTQIDALLCEYAISYIKWDMNRIHTLPGDSQGRAASYCNTLALYALFDRIRQSHPHVEIESCASGGARIDYEILTRCHRFWTSDSNDAVERWSIQKGFSYFFPPELMGSHIGPAFSHSSGRGVSLSFRGLAVLMGHFGLEFDITQISDSEQVQLSALIDLHKSYRALWHTGRFYRLFFADENMFGVSVVSNNKSQAQAIVAQTGRVRNTLPNPLTITGLDAARHYSVRTLVVDESVRRANRRTIPVLGDKPLHLSGQVLQRSGIQLPILEAQSGIALQFDAVD